MLLHDAGCSRNLTLPGLPFPFALCRESFLGNLQLAANDLRPFVVGARVLEIRVIRVQGLFDAVELFVRLSQTETKITVRRLADHRFFQRAHGFRSVSAVELRHPESMVSHRRFGIELNGILQNRFGLFDLPRLL